MNSDSLRDSIIEKILDACDFGYIGDSGPEHIDGDGLVDAGKAADEILKLLDN